MTTFRIPASYQPYLLVVFVLAMFAVAMWGNPYRNENYTSGRYLPIPLRSVDARLFQNSAWPCSRAGCLTIGGS
jgi:hypothetical protein